MQIAARYVKRCSTSLAIEGMQVRSAVKLRLTP